ncbi:MAG: FecR domain-containing protein [Verrucomicrobiota bacterium]
MKTSLVLAGWFAGGILPALGVLPLTESTFTEIIHEANVITATNKAGIPARTHEVFKVPDLVRTGLDSRVELTAKDHTITRVGANTTFTFAASGRDLELKQGGILFHAPTGVGGGTIKYRGSSAAVLGTTVLAEVLPDGSFKVIDLEGRVKVTLQNGQLVTLMPGQMVIVAANGNAMSAVRNFKLGQLAPILLGVVGFSHPLASAPLTEAAILQQDQRIVAGEVTELVSLPVASLGLDITARTITGLVPQTGNRSQQRGPVPGTDPTDRAAPVAANGFSRWANPLDFPGATLVNPLESNPGGLLLKFSGASDTVPPVISPPAITEMSLGGSGVP